MNTITIPLYSGRRRSPISDEGVEFIRNSDLSQIALAEMFGVNQSVISTIKTGKTRRKPWKEVGRAVVLDDEFTHEVLMKITWHLHRHGTGKQINHVATRTKGQDGRMCGRYLHQYVFEHYHGELPPGHVIDHIDRNPLNNMPDNLRAASRKLQRLNSTTSNSTGYKGVRWHKAGNGWQARLSLGGSKEKHLGLFDTPEEAASVVRGAYRKLYPDLCDDAYLEANWPGID